MRKFHSENFSIQLADGLSSIHLNIPDDEAQDALDYIKQFIQRGNGDAYLHRGYITEDQLDALVRIRDASTNSRQFARAVEALGVDGDVSQEADYDEFRSVDIKPTRDTINELNDTYYEVRTDDARKMVRSIQNICRYNNNTLYLHLPVPVARQIFSP